MSIRERIDEDFEVVDDKIHARIQTAMNLSIAANVLLSTANLYAVISSGSLAVLASLVDTLLDLVSQIVLKVTSICMAKPSDKDFPAGKEKREREV